MKRVSIIPISKVPKKTQCIINNAIFNLENNYSVKFIPDLCKGLDSNKYMLTYDYDPDGVGVANPSLGVEVVEGSENMEETERRINEAIENLVITKNKSFVNITRVSEFIYIILFEYKSGHFPTIRIRASIKDCSTSSDYLSRELEEWEDEEDIIPFDCFTIDNDYIMYLCN